MVTNERAFAMNPMNDQRFFDLAMRAIRHQATEAERAELDAAMANQPELRTELERLQADERLAREVLPVAAASEATEAELPGYARGRLRTKVRETFGTPTAAAERKQFWMRWGWIGLAAGVAVLALVFSLRVEQPRKLEIQVAMLDLAGTTRGSNTNELDVLKQIQPGVEVSTFASESELTSWEKTFPADSKHDAVKIIYDRAAGEVRVVGRVNGEAVQAVFTVGDDLASALNKAAAFARSQAKNR